MKTDLAKIISISGQHGLFLYLAQARNGAIVEALSTKKRVIVDAKSRITSLADISIYAADGEVKLAEVLASLKEVLSGEAAPSSKSAPEELKALFLKAIPEYDDTRFHVSHMKKVVEWYNELREHASLDFVNPDEEAAEEAGEEVSEE